MSIPDELQPWELGQRLIIVTPDQELNAQPLSEDGVPEGNPVSLRNGAFVEVAELRLLGYTDVRAGGKRYRMLSNKYLSEPQWVEH